MEGEDKGQWVRKGGISGRAHWHWQIVMHVKCVCVWGGAGSVKGGWRMSLRSVESVMTSCGAVTSDGEGVWGTEERKETQHHRKGSDSRNTERGAGGGGVQGKFVVGQRLILPALRAPGTEERYQ